jgi:hypothetical protein
VSFESDPKKTGHAPVPATGPLAGTSYDFRALFPDMIVPARVPPPAANRRGRTTRRELFGMLRTKKAKP